MSKFFTGVFLYFLLGCLLASVAPMAVWQFISIILIVMAIAANEGRK